MKKKRPHLWADSSEYRKWTSDRDKALEVFLFKARQKHSKLIYDLMDRVLSACSSYYHAMKSDAHGYTVDHIDQELKQIFDSYIPEFYKIILELRRRSYVLSKASEAEIIARMKKGPVDSRISTALARQASVPKFTNNQRIKYYLDKLRRKVLTTAQISAIREPALSERVYLVQILNAFPKRKPLPKRPVLKPVKKFKEAWDDIDDDELDELSDYAIDMIDAAEWQDMVSEYLADDIAVNGKNIRGPDVVVDMPTTRSSDEMEIFGWEIERDLTHEFVQAVREGQVQAANDNDITDFVWIAIIDKSTCEDCCGDYGCVDFDGMLTSEVEELTGGETSVPPAHFNCRCTLAPATDEMPEIPDDGAKEFSEWLES